ncbi:MAG TPA: IclR family transcriptional regulator [Variovorax sp.]
METPPKTVPPGPLQRGSALLRLLAAAGVRGVPLSQLSVKSAMAHATVHRLLAHLIREGLAIQIEDTRRYALGPLAFELGLAAAQRYDLRGMFRPTLERLAAEAADTAYVHIRSGYEAVCLDMVEGPSAIRVVPLRIGSRRPLGLGAGGLAILAQLEEDEAQDILAQVAPYIEREWNFPEEALRASVDESRRNGFALICNRVVPGVTAIGVTYRDSMGRVSGALTIAAPNERMGPARIAVTNRLLTHAVKDAERAWREGHAYSRS